MEFTVRLNLPRLIPIIFESELKHTDQAEEQLLWIVIELVWNQQMKYLAQSSRVDELISDEKAIVVECAKFFNSIMLEHGFIQKVATSGRLNEAVQLFEAAVCYTNLEEISHLSLFI